MFGDSVTKQLVRIENEQRAQKSATKLNFGQLVKPGTSPTATYSGFVNNQASNPPVATWVATFTRSDGVTAPPFVQFQYDYALGLYSNDDAVASGATSVTGRDRHAVDEWKFSDGVHEVGTNYVKWRIEIGNGWSYTSASGSNVDLTVKAVSIVPGTLSLTRTL